MEMTLALELAEEMTLFAASVISLRGFLKLLDACKPRNDCACFCSFFVEVKLIFSLLSSLSVASVSLESLESSLVEYS
jgi:hypothetical protein